MLCYTCNYKLLQSKPEIQYQGNFISIPIKGINTLWKCNKCKKTKRKFISGHSINSNDLPENIKNGCLFHKWKPTRSEGYIDTSYGLTVESHIKIQKCKKCNIIKEKHFYGKKAPLIPQ